MQVSAGSARGDAANPPPRGSIAPGLQKCRVYLTRTWGNNRQFSVGPSMQRGMKPPHDPPWPADKGKNARTRAIVNRANPRAFETFIRDAAIGNRSGRSRGKRSRGPEMFSAGKKGRVQTDTNADKRSNLSKADFAKMSAKIFVDKDIMGSVIYRDMMGNCKNGIGRFVNDVSRSIP